MWYLEIKHLGKWSPQKWASDPANRLTETTEIRKATKLSEDIAGKTLDELYRHFNPGKLTCSLCETNPSADCKLCNGSADNSIEVA